MSFIREQPFATIAVTVDGAVLFAYAPVVLDTGNALGSVRFHLAANNPVANIQEGSRMHFSFVGPNAYVSPDWYASPGLVPTWNYIAVEGEGYARFLDVGRIARFAGRSVRRTRSEASSQEALDDRQSSAGPAGGADLGHCRVLDGISKRSKASSSFRRIRSQAI